ncbi:hypothetical protein FN846DRAFT_910406 [Sphaerosporella brunnea]|uniref:Uncharacterized protein n=1 Tax=Sphaerosporella brunnea TaxID=1250544 RepID=A0A5J5EN63_9PEZI|nr:hypothetical protein FN846DRAFT_910406 [Sphaerosporella brunnea]
MTPPGYVRTPTICPQSAQQITDPEPTADSPGSPHAAIDQPRRGGSSHGPICSPGIRPLQSHAARQEDINEVFETVVDAVEGWARICAQRMRKLKSYPTRPEGINEVFESVIRWVEGGGLSNCRAAKKRKHGDFSRFFCRHE